MIAGGKYNSSEKKKNLYYYVHDGGIVFTNCLKVYHYQVYLENSGIRFYWRTCDRFTNLLHKRFVTSDFMKALLHFSISKLANDKHFIATVCKNLYSASCFVHNLTLYLIKLFLLQMFYTVWDSVLPTDALLSNYTSKWS